MPHTSLRVLAAAADVLFRVDPAAQAPEVDTGRLEHLAVEADGTTANDVGQLGWLFKEARKNGTIV